MPICHDMLNSPADIIYIYVSIELYMMNFIDITYYIDIESWMEI